MFFGAMVVPYYLCGFLCSGNLLRCMRLYRSPSGHCFIETVRMDVCVVCLAVHAKQNRKLGVVGEKLATLLTS